MVANQAYYAMRERAAEYGMTGDMLAKNDRVIDGGLRCSRSASARAFRSATALTCWALQAEESREFIIRSEVLSPLEIIRSPQRRRGSCARRQDRHAEGGCL